MLLSRIREQYSADWSTLAKGSLMRQMVITYAVLLGTMSCASQSKPASDATASSATLIAMPSVFILHENDMRETTVSVTNDTSQVINLSSLMVLGLELGTMSFTETTCTATLAPHERCSATGHLIATSSGQANFQITLGDASTPLSIIVMPACPATCGPSGITNCCMSSIIPGNAAGGTLAGQPFYRSNDMNALATVSDFRLDTYEVTVGRFRTFVNAGMGTKNMAPNAGAGAHRKISGSGWDTTWNANLTADITALISAINCDPNYQTWTNTSGTNDSRPMNCITWYEAMAFCIWDGGYLPTEAEWNYAASGGSEQRDYPWSSDRSTSIDCSYANYQNSVIPPMYCTAEGANRAGSESPLGDGRWGQADLAGNVDEWNLDWYSQTLPSPCDDCANLSIGPNHLIRGGGFGSPAGLLSSRARYLSPALRINYIGVRCARMP